MIEAISSRTVVCDSRGVVDVLKLHAAIIIKRDIANDVEGREHGLDGIGHARKRTNVGGGRQSRRSRGWRWILATVRHELRLDAGEEASRPRLL